MLIMKDIELLNPTKNDLEELKGIWHSAFDSRDAELFFDFFYNYDLCLVSKSNNKAVAMGHLLPIGDLVTNDNTPIPATMIYAVATLPEYRKLGLGSAISENLIKLAQGADYPAVVLCPAVDSLFDFYNAKTSMKEWFYASEYKLMSPLNTKKRIGLSEISPNEYINLRDKLLQGIPHIRYNQRVAEYQKGLCELFGGGLFQISSPYGDSCIIIERQTSDTLCIKELVISTSVINSGEYIEYLQDIAAGAISMFPANECIIRTPAIHSQPAITTSNIGFTTKRFAMLSLPPELQKTSKTTTPQAWYGLAFD